MKRLLCSAALLCIATSAWALPKSQTIPNAEIPQTFVTGTVTVTIYKYNQSETIQNPKPPTKVKIVVTSTAGGAATFTTDRIQGTITRMKTDPGATAPTALWDFTILDADGVDAIDGTGADRDTANTEYYNGFEDTYGNIGYLPLIGSHTFTFANMGNAKVAVVYLWIQE